MLVLGKRRCEQRRGRNKKRQRGESRAMKHLHSMKLPLLRYLIRAAASLIMLRSA